MEAPILSASQTRPLTLDGVTYTLRALSYAEVSAFGLAAAGRPQPSQAVMMDAVRTACTDAGRLDLAEALDAYDAAQDALAALFATRPSSLDEAGQDAWRREHAGEIRAAQAAVFKAERQREVALYVASDSPVVQRLRAELLHVAQGDTQEIVAAGVVAIDGRLRTLTLDEAAALPAGHVMALAAELRRMIRPSESAEKN